MQPISKREKQQINLKVLRQQYRDGGRALRGYNQLIKLIRSKNEKELEKKLRYHLPDRITVLSEIRFRDNVDFLLKFYSLVEIAILAGYIPPSLTNDLQEEIIEVLGNKYVRLYYGSYYKITLPDLLFKMISSGVVQKPIGTSDQFVDLLLIDKSIDDDVENFLWLLDSGWFDDYSIASMRQTLRSRSQIEQIISKPRKDETYADSAFWGFIKFAEYMQQYERLLRQCENDLLRSVLWHFQSYWFDRIDGSLQKTYISALHDIEILNSKVTFDQFKKNTNYDHRNLSMTEIDKKNVEAFKKFKEATRKQTEKTISCVQYNLDKSHAEALNNYCKI